MDHWRENLAALERTSPQAAAEVRAAHPPDGAAVEPSRRGEPALRIGAARLTSSVDPAAEGRALAAAAPAGPLAVLGFALGHHLEPLLGRDVVVWEPDPGLLRLALASRDLTAVLAGLRVITRPEPELLAGRATLVHPPTARLHPGPAQALARLAAGGTPARQRPARPRVLVVPPVLGGTLPMAYWCAEALEHLGCRVATVPLEAVRPLYDLVRRSRRPQEELDRVRRPMVRFLGEAALLAAREHRPHLVLALAQAPLDRAAIAGLGELGAATAMWFVENHRHMGYYREIAASYDHFFHIQPGPLEDELQRLGARHAFLPLAAHPPVHRPLCLEPDEVRRWGAEIGFMGCGYPNRREVLARLAGRGLEVALWGTSWGPLASRVREGGRRLETREVVKIYNACQMVLNLHSSPEAGDGVAAQDFVNPRTFEVAACGGFQLVDRVRGLEGLFKPGAEIAAYASEEELVELARHYRDRPEERAALAAKARRRALAEHTYYHRMESLLEACLGRAPAEDALDPAGAAGRAAETLLDSLAPAEGVRAL